MKWQGLAGDGNGSEMEEDGSFFRTVARWEAVRREDCLNWSRAWASDNNAKNNHNELGIFDCFPIFFRFYSIPSFKPNRRLANSLFSASESFKTLKYAIFSKGEICV